MIRKSTVREAFWSRQRRSGFLPGGLELSPPRGRRLFKPSPHDWCDDLTLVRAPQSAEGLFLGLLYTSAVYPRDLERMARRAIERKPYEDDPSILVLIAPRVSDRARELLRSLQVGFIDLQGNCLLQRTGGGPPFHFEISGGDRGRERVPIAKGNPFRGDRASARVVRVLLASVHEPIRIARLAREAGVSLGLVHATLERLRRDAFVAGPRMDEKIADPRELLRRFAEDYGWEAVTHAEPFFTARPVAGFRAEVSAWARRTGTPLAFTLESGIEPEFLTVTSSLTAFYCGAPSSLLAGELGLSRVPSGPNVLILAPPPRADSERGGVYHALRELPWGPAVSTVQLYIDLHAQRGRLGEQAEDLLQRGRFA